MGHAITKIAKEAWSGIKKGADVVGHGIEKGADAVYHVGKEAVDDVGDALEKCADIATTVVVDVGGVAEHVVQFIPGPLGTTLSNGLAGVVDIAKKGDAGVHDVVDIVQNPKEAIEKAYSIITHPSELKEELEKAADLVKGVSGDVTEVLLAAAAVTPEGAEIAPELVALANIGSKVSAAATAGQDLLSGNVSAALNAGIGFLPKNAQQLAKAVTASVDVENALQKGNFAAAIKAATPYLPKAVRNKTAQLEKAITKARSIQKKLQSSEKKKGKKRPRHQTDGMYEWNRGLQPSRTSMLCMNPEDPLVAIHQHFQLLHPNDPLTYYIFSEGRNGPEFHTVIWE